MQRVRKSVLRVTKGRQVPWDHSSLTGESYFKKAVSRFAPPAASTRAQPPTAGVGTQRQSAELLFWQSIGNSKDPTDYQAYLRQFPKGIFASLAHSRIQKFRRVSSPTLGHEEKSEKNARAILDSEPRNNFRERVQPSANYVLMRQKIISRWEEKFEKIKREGPHAHCPMWNQTLDNLEEVTECQERAQQIYELELDKKKELDALLGIPVGPIDPKIPAPAK